MKPTRSIFAAAVIAALVLSACKPEEKAAPPSAPVSMPPAEVDVVTAEPATVLLTEDLPGRLEAYRTSQVRARVDGIVEKRLFGEGNDVKEGQALFQIDARNYQANYAAARADAVLALQTIERYKPLLAGNLVSQQDFDTAQSKFKQTESALSKARLDLENTRVPAPISGRIGRAQVTEGALVGHSEPTLLATIEQIDPIYANFTQAGDDWARLQQAIKSGKLKPASANVQLVLDDGRVYEQSGTLLFSNLAVDPETGGVSLRAVFPNPQHELLPGMFARIRFSQGNAEGVLAVPQRAVQTGAQGQFVLVVEGGKVAMHPVVTGDMAGENFVIKQGLKPGDQVIVNGLQKVRPGAPAKAVQWHVPGISPAPVSAVAASAVVAEKK